jgi:hypothetical protein
MCAILSWKFLCFTAMFRALLATTSTVSGAFDELNCVNLLDSWPRVGLGLVTASHVGP